MKHALACRDVADSRNSRSMKRQCQRSFKTTTSPTATSAVRTSRPLRALPQLPLCFRVFPNCSNSCKRGTGRMASALKAVRMRRQRSAEIGPPPRVETAIPDLTRAGTSAVGFAGLTRRWSNILYLTCLTAEFCYDPRNGFRQALSTQGV